MHNLISAECLQLLDMIRSLVVEWVISFAKINTATTTTRFQMSHISHVVLACRVKLAVRSLAALLLLPLPLLLVSLRTKRAHVLLMLQLQLRLPLPLLQR